MSDFAISEASRSGDSTVVSARVPVDLKYLDGHFPGNPIVAGIAQLALVERAVRHAYPDLGAPRSLARLKFEARIDPGDALEVELSRTPDAKVKFLIRRGETICSRGTLGY